MSAANRVVLDANVLFPAALRDTILRLAAAGRLEVFWSAAILEETGRNLVLHAAQTEAKVARLVARMNKSFPNAMVAGHEHHIPYLRNHPDDRHVVAAAIECEADAVVTFNLKDFASMPDGISAVSPSDLLCHHLEREPGLTLQLLREQAAALRNPACTLSQLIETLAKMVKPFTDEVRALLADQPPDGP